MPKLRTLSNNTLNGLSPAALHKLGCLFSKISSNFQLEPQPDLEECAVNERRMPINPDMKEVYKDYKLAFLEQMDKLNATIKEDVEVMLLAHYLHLGHSNGDYVDKVESLMPYMKRKTASDAEYLVHVMLNPGGEKALRKASLMLSSSRTYGYEYFVVDEQALPFTCTPKHVAGMLFDDAYANEIREGLQQRYGTSICVVRSEMKNGLWIVEITHGGTKRKESNENNAETIDILRQPIEVDCLIYDPTYNDIRIHMENKTSSILDLYRKSFGQCLYDNHMYWCSSPKYYLKHFNIPRVKLQEMLVRGATRLSNAAVGKLSISIPSVTYKFVRRLWGGKYSTETYTRKCVDGFNYTMEDSETLAPRNATIVSVTLRFEYGGSKKKSLPINITEKRRTMESEAIPGIEDWLHDEGFSRSGAVHKKEEPVEDTIGAPLMVAEGTEGDDA